MSAAPTLSLTRRYRFAAAHVLRSRALSDDENERVYGKCANPGGHGHNYGLEVTVRGAVDRETGAMVSVDWLDRVVDDRVLRRVSHTMLNDDVWFRDRVPTAENIVAFAEEQLADALSEGGVALERVVLHETRRNTFSCGAE